MSLILRIVVLAAAVAVGAATIGGSPGGAADLWPYPHSCYAGCCLTCQGGLCCYDEEPVPAPGAHLLPNPPSHP